MAKSAATMLALSGNQIVMDVASELGPIDPQFNFRKGDGTYVTAPAQAIIDQFEAAQKKIAKDPSILAPWLPILQQYGPALYQQAQNAIKLSKDLVKKWLMKYMLKDGPKRNPGTRGRQHLSDHNNFKSHAKRIGLNDIREIKALKAINVLDMREDPELGEQGMGPLSCNQPDIRLTAAYKLFESTSGSALIRLIQQVQIVGQAKQ